ncbi:10252_t:CDS:2, partial [Gigaspora rosea]
MSTAKGKPRTGNYLLDGKLSPSVITGLSRPNDKTNFRLRFSLGDPQMRKDWTISIKEKNERIKEPSNE